MKNGNKTQYALLGALSIEPMSGYEIQKMMAGSTNHFWTESNGQIYPTLQQLTKLKEVSCKESYVGAKPRKIYTITKKGMQKLQQWLLQDVVIHPARNELLLKLFYGQNVPPKVSIAHIKAHELRCIRALALYKDIAKTLEKMVKLKQRPVYFLLTVKAGVSLVKTELAWCKDAIKLINKYT